MFPSPRGLTIFVVNAAADNLVAKVEAAVGGNVSSPIAKRVCRGCS